MNVNYVMSLFISDIIKPCAGKAVLRCDEVDKPSTVRMYEAYLLQCKSPMIDIGHLNSEQKKLLADVYSSCNMHHALGKYPLALGDTHYARSKTPFGEMVNRIRISNNVDIHEFVKGLSISRSHFRGVCQGTYTPRVDYATRIATMMRLGDDEYKALVRTYFDSYDRLAVRPNTGFAAYAAELIVNAYD